MTTQTFKRYVRPYAEVCEIVLDRARNRRNPFDTWADPAVVEEVMRRLDTVDRDAWAAAFSAAAAPHEEKARRAEHAGDADRAKAEYLAAYSYYRAARYPIHNSPGKQAAYDAYRRTYLAAAKYFHHPVEVVDVPFQGRPGEGSRVVFYVRRPRTAGPHPVLMTWGGIDTFKEDRRPDAYLERGIAIVAIDMPGVGEAPVAGSEDAERMFDPAFAWIASQPDLDESRVALWGLSTGGYWATKVAHTHRDRVRASVSQGGCAHFAFQRDWIEKAQHGEYPLELAETLAFTFGMRTLEDWLENAPRFSLLDLGVLDRPSAPILGINGVHDSVFPIDDYYLLLQHGSPKTLRLFDTGHMGHSPTTQQVIMDWLCGQLESI